MPSRSAAPVVAVLAGGRGERLGGSKPTTALGGRPLITYPLAAARAAGLAAVVVAKPQTPLPPLPERVVHDHEPLHHPLAGVLAALAAADCVIAMACDMPFVTAAMLRWLAEPGAPSLVRRAGGRLQPFPARYERRHVPSLRRSLRAERSLQASIADLSPQIADGAELDAFGPADRLLFSVNTLADLRAAERWLTERQPVAYGRG